MYLIYKRLGLPPIQFILFIIILIRNNWTARPLMQQNFVTDTSRITGAACYVPNKQDENCWSC